MKTENNKATDEVLIRDRLESWTKAVRAKDLEGVMSNYAPDNLLFDLAPPLQYRGADACLRHWPRSRLLALRPLARRDDFAGSAASSRRRTIAYWVTTGLLALECGVGGVMGALQLPPFSGIMKHLGYPTFFMTIIGVWYILAALAILATRFPRLKEWAYAGLVFIYTGAIASRRAVDDPAVTLVGPIIFTALVAVLRPSPPHAVDLIGCEAAAAHCKGRIDPGVSVVVRRIRLEAELFEELPSPPEPASEHVCVEGPTGEASKEAVTAFECELGTRDA
jgi:hypothetical protein